MHVSHQDGTTHFWLLPVYRSLHFLGNAWLDIIQSYSISYWSFLWDYLFYPFLLVFCLIFWLCLFPCCTYFFQLCLCNLEWPKHVSYILFLPSFHLFLCLLGKAYSTHPHAVRLHLSIFLFFPATWTCPTHRTNETTATNTRRNKMGTSLFSILGK